jgi:outer membrane lipoprotein-sorting protein
MKLRVSTSKKNSGSGHVRTWWVLLLWGLILGSWSFRACAAQPIPVVAEWLNAQAKIHTWSADFVQTRSLKSLSQPLTANGHLWFAEPNRIRWELGHPAQTIAIIGPQEMLLVYPRLKRAERYSLAGGQTSQWGDVMKLLQAGFSRNRADLEAEYNILDQQVAGDVCEVTLQPKSAAARKMMPRIKIGFSTKDFMLRSSELEFADGSKLRNDYKNSELNPKLDEALFTQKVEGNFKVTEPLNQR